MKTSRLLATVFAFFAVSAPLASAQLLGGLIPALCACQPGTRCALLIGCIPCAAGYSSPGSATSCTICPAVSDYCMDLSVCWLMSQNTFSFRGGSCYPCSAGSGSTAGSSSCRPCPAGTSSISGGGCRQCPAGSMSGAGATRCETCPAGSSAANGGARCQACPRGSFQDQAGQQGCKLCPAGTRQSSAGATSCETCPVCCPTPPARRT